MVLKTETIDIDITLPDGTELADATFIATISAPSWDNTDNQAVPKVPVSVPLSATGTGVINLWPNDRGDVFTYYTATVRATLPGEFFPKTFHIGPFRPKDNGGPYSLNVLLSEGFDTISSITPTLVARAETAAVSAEASAAAAAASAAAAQAAFQYIDGSFGIGVTTPPILADLDALDTPSGFYRTTTDTLNIDNRPAGTSPVGYLRIERFTSGAFTQYFTSVFPEKVLGTGTFYRKYRVLSTPQWSPWRRVYDSNNLVGTVSQSGGVPTGAVIERGANANGEYVRWADGTQICWHRLNMGSITAGGSGTLTDPYRTAGFSWTFPASFSASFLPEVIETAEFDDPITLKDRVVSVSKGPRNATTVFNLQLFRWADSSNPTEYFLSLVAIGRWF